MTARELRQMLANVWRQNMTVSELREILFEVEDQDKELTDADMILITNSIDSIKAVYPKLTQEEATKLFFGK